MKKADARVVEEFGQEWCAFPQDRLKKTEHVNRFNEYFSLLPESYLRGDSVAIDFGAGSGRWAQCVAPKVQRLIIVEPSSAMDVAHKKLGHHSNVEFHQTTIDDFETPQLADFAYCLGVLHHVPDTQSAFDACAKNLKPGAPLLVYMYYNFENKPWWFRTIWKASDFLRKVLCRMPQPIKYACSQVIAVTAYYPLARISKLLEKAGINTDNIPLSYYRNTGFYSMRTDALDRFGTRLEKRYSKKDIVALYDAAGFENVSFRNGEPYWCAIGYKKR